MKTRGITAAIGVFLIGAAAGCVVFQSHSIDVTERGDLWLGPVTIVIPQEARLQDRWIHIQAGRIVSIGLTPSEGARKIWEGGFVLPGLIDLHVHFAPRVAPGSADDFTRLFLLHGVTTVREVGTIDGSAFWIRDQIEAGNMAGPRIFSCGPMLDGTPKLQSFAKSIGVPSDAEEVVRSAVDSGADCIKVYENLAPETLAAIRKSANDRGLTVVGHVPRGISLADSQIDEVQHLTGILPRPLEPGIANPEWLSELARRFREVDDATIETYVQESVDHGVLHTPTLVSFLRDAQQSEYADQLEKEYARLLPGYWRDVLWNPNIDERFIGLSPETWDALRETVKRRQEIVGLLHAAGVPILAGTDTPNPFVVPGAGLHEELRLLAESGLSIEEAWVAATAGAGGALRVAGLGHIEDGAPADLLWFSEDPTQDLDSLDSLSGVIADGRVYSIDDLRRVSEERQRQFESPVYDRLSSVLVRIGIALLR